MSRIPYPDPMRAHRRRMRVIVVLSIVVGLAIAGLARGQEEEGAIELTHDQLVSWLTRSHLQLQYPSATTKDGGELLARKLLADIDRWFSPVDPPPQAGIPEPTWTWDGRVFTRLRDGVQFTGSEVEDWLGSDMWSTSSRNNQPLPGKRPGDVLHVGPGAHAFGRWTLHYDLDAAAIALNPTRLGDPVKYPSKPFTYLSPAGDLRYGGNNRDKLKGIWTRPTAATSLEPAYPAWFRWGYDEQTWVVGTLNDDGSHATIFPGCYHEMSGAASVANVLYESNGTSKGIWQTENPKAHDASGSSTWGNWPEDPDAVSYEWQGWRDIELRNVGVLGKPRPNQSKWGVFSYRLGMSARGDDVPGFLHAGGFIGEIWWEHANYHHNVRGNNPEAFAFYAHDIRIWNCERTAYQFVSRPSEGPPGQGRIVLERIQVRNVCLEQGGGGSAFTFAGNHQGDVVLREIDCHLGDGSLQTDSVTGGFVSWDGNKDGGTTRSITLEDCVFRVGPLTGKGAARRPNLNVGAVDTFRMVRTAVVQAAGAREAVQFHDTIGRLVLGADCDVRGDVLFGAQVWRDDDGDGDGWDDGTAWAAFLEEIRTGTDTNGDGVVAGESDVVDELVIEEVPVDANGGGQ